jgi:hypothetical protein
LLRLQQPQRQSQRQSLQLMPPAAYVAIQMDDSDGDMDQAPAAGQDFNTGFGMGGMHSGFGMGGMSSGNLSSPPRQNQMMDQMRMQQQMMQQQMMQQQMMQQQMMQQQQQMNQMQPGGRGRGRGNPGSRNNRGAFGNTGLGGGMGGMGYGNNY